MRKNTWGWKRNGLCLKSTVAAQPPKMWLTGPSVGLTDVPVCSPSLQIKVTRFWTAKEVAFPISPLLHTLYCISLLHHKPITPLPYLSISLYILIYHQQIFWEGSHPKLFFLTSLWPFPSIITASFSKPLDYGGTSVSLQVHLNHAQLYPISPPPHHRPAPSHDNQLLHETRVEDRVLFKKVFLHPLSFYFFFLFNTNDNASIISLTS